MADSEHDKLLNNVKSMLRSILISVKEGIPAHRIEYEYRELADESIPYRKLGFRTIQDFIKAIPDVVRIATNREGGPQLFPVANQETAHIMKMVKAQRSKKVRSKKPGKAPVRRPYNSKPSYRPAPSRYPSRPPNYYRPPQRPQFRPSRPPLRPDNMGTSRRSQSSYDWSQKNISSTSRTSYQNFSVTVSGRRGGDTVELDYGSKSNDPDSENRKPKLASVVVKPSVYKQIRAGNFPQKDTRFGERYEIPPRFKSQGERTPTNYQDVERGKLYKKLVLDYCRRNDFPDPKYDVLPDKNAFFCSLEINGQTYASREAYQNREAAEEAAALNACETLSIEKGLQSASRRAAEKASQVQDCDPKVKERLLEIVKSKERGIWLSRIPVEYKEKFKSEAPPNILALLQSWQDCVKLEGIENGSKYIVHFIKPDLKIEPAYKFPLNLHVKVYMSFLTHHGDFYLQRAELDLSDMIKSVNECSQHSERIPGPEVKKGMFCVGKYSDNSWCRAQVLNYTPRNNTVELMWIDYGNKGTVSIEAIRKLNRKLSTPAQAVPCVLHGVEPFDGDIWDDSVLDFIDEAIGDMEHEALTLSYKDNVCVVELYTTADENEPVNLKLVKQGLLKPTVEEYANVLATLDASENMANVSTDPGNPGPLIFPEENYWNVCICMFTSINNITFRLVGENYSDMLAELEVELEKVFKKEPSVGLAEDSVCIAHVDELYHRVRILELRSNNQAVCHYLDHGDTEELNLHQLKLIPPEYNTLPYQAAHCSLYGLDNGNESQLTLALEKLNLTGTVVVAEVFDSIGRHHSVVLYDTSGDEDVNVNQLVAEMVAKEEQMKTPTPGNELPHRFNFPTPSDDQLSVSSESSTTSSSGRQEPVTVKPKFLQLQSSRETSAINDTDSLSSESSSASERPVTLKPRFLTKSTDQSPNQLQGNDNVLHNISNNAISNVSQSGAFPTDIQTLHSGFQSLDLGCGQSDLGFSEHDFRLADTVQQPTSIEPALLDQFAQGVTSDSILGTSLPHGINLPTDSLGFVINMADIPLPESSSDFSSMSDQEFGGQNETSSSTLGMDRSNDRMSGTLTPTPYSPNQMVNNTYTAVTPTQNSLNLVSMGAFINSQSQQIMNIDIWSGDYLNLPVPPSFEPPPVGEFVDVHVRWVSSPSNFVCMPYDSLPDYTYMMAQLSQYIAQNPPIRKLSIEEIKVGHLYAGMTANVWYRVVVCHCLDQSNLVVKLADIGEFENLTLDDLQPLPTYFWTLPFQAFKAKLHGVTVEDSKGWKEASKFKFIELVINKDLVGLVKEKDTGHGVVSLALADTSGDTDIYIMEELVKHVQSWQRVKCYN